MGKILQLVHVISKTVKQFQERKLLIHFFSLVHLFTARFQILYNKKTYYILPNFQIIVIK